MAQATKPKLGFKRGGHVKGPGTETSDSIPALLSDGEYVLPADTVRAIGVKALDQLKNATHTPSGNAKEFIPGFADGGVPGLIGQERLDKQNAETAASSIVKDASQQAGQAQLDAMNKPPEAPATAAATAATQPSMTPGLIGADRLNQQNAATAQSSLTAPAAAPATTPSVQQLATKPAGAPALGFAPSTAPITRVGNSFSNFNATNEDPAYRGLKMDPNDPGNQRAIQSISPFAARGFAGGGLVEDERKKRIAQIPGSAPEGWAGGTGTPVTGNEFTRNVSNTAQALAPVMPMASGAAKLATAVPKLLASPAGQTALAYGVPAAGAMALMGAASSKPDQPSNPPAADTPRPGNPDRLYPMDGQTNSAPDGTPKSPGSDAPMATQQPASAPAVIQPPQPAAGFVPAQIRHSGNDWQARNDLRNLQVSASSITEKDDPNSPAMLAYKAALVADQALKEGKNPTIESQNRDAAFMDRTQAGENAANYRAQVANSIDQQRVDNEGVKLGFEANAAKQIQALQREIVNDDGKDPKRTAALQEKMQLLTGKWQPREPANRLTVVPGGSSVDEKTGQVVQRPSLVVDNQTGNVINVHGGGAPARKAPEVGVIYEDANGNKAKWDGSKYVPVK